MLRKFLRVVGVNALLIAMMIIAVEVAFGNWFEPSVLPRSAIRDQTLTFRQTLYDPASIVTYTRDRDGLRAVHGPLEQVSLVTLGGSTTDQRFITEGETWQDVLASLARFEVANAGIDGMSSSGHLVALQEWLYRIPKLRARYFLHYIGVNDAWLPNHLAPSDQAGTNSLATRIRLRSAIVHGAAHLWQLAGGSTLAQHARIVPHELDTIVPVKAVVNREEIQAFIDTRYKPNLQRILELHQSRGERAIFVSQPTHPAVLVHKDDEVFTRSYLAPPRWAVALEMMNAATAQVCGSRPHTCHFIDVAGQLEFEEADFYDSVHVTPAGARRLAAFLAGELTEFAKRDSEFAALFGPMN